MAVFLFRMCWCFGLLLCLSSTGWAQAEDNVLPEGEPQGVADPETEAVAPPLLPIRGLPEITDESPADACLRELERVRTADRKSVV